MKIKCLSEVALDGHKTTITSYDGTIDHEGHDIGIIRFSKINRQGATFADFDWALEGQDSDDTELDWLFDDYGNVNLGTKKYRGNVFCFAHLMLHKKYRGIDLGYFLLHRVLRSYGSDCEVALLWAKPLQFLFSSKYKKEFDTYPQDQDRAYKQLKNYYRKFGFKSIRRTINHPLVDRNIKNHMYLDLKDYFLKESPYDCIPDSLINELERKLGFPPETSILGDLLENLPPIEGDLQCLK